MKLSQELPAAADLDSVIRAHDEYVALHADYLLRVASLCRSFHLLALTRYLDGIVQNVLLDEESTLVRSLLIRIFTLIFKFCNIQVRFVCHNHRCVAVRLNAEFSHY